MYLCNLGLVALTIIARSVRADLVTDLRALSLSSGTEIAGSSDPSYQTDFTQRWSSYAAPSYVAAVKPATEDDVVKVVEYAAASAIPFLATGAGHGFPITLANLQQGLQLDLSNFNTVRVEGNTMTIGGGVRFSDIIGPLGAARKELPIGSESCVGVVGATLGGGVSRFNGLHGMLVDSLRQVRMVTANGSLIRASSVENSDLFWGVRGAGFLYGIVLEATYEVYDETVPEYLNADFLFPANASHTVWEYLKTMENDLPAELSILTVAGYAKKYGGAFIVVNAVYAGSQADGSRLLQPLFSAFPTRTNLSMVTWSQINSAAFFGLEPAGSPCPAKSTHNVYAAAVSQIDVPTFDVFYEQFNQLVTKSSTQTAGTIFYVELFPIQAVQAVPYNATSYPWRGVTAYILFVFAYNDVQLDETINQIGREARANFTATGGLDPAQLYVSYGHGDEDPEMLYSADNLPHLRELKAEWDPDGMFDFNHPLS